MGWDEFVASWDDAIGPTIKATTFSNYQTTFRAFERHVRPTRLRDLTTAKITAFAAGLRKDGLSEASVKRHLGALRAVSRWACRQELLPKVPTFDMPKRGAAAKMKGRPITGEEFDRMLAAVPKVVIENYDPNTPRADIDADPRVASWRELLLGLWWSGLRLGEAIALRADQQPGGVWAILDGRNSMLAFDAGSLRSRARSSSSRWLRKPQRCSWGCVGPAGSTSTRGGSVAGN